MKDAAYPERPLTIALVSRYYPPTPGGGLALFTQQIAREMVRQGHKVLVITATPFSKAALNIDQGVEIHRIPQRKVFQRSLTGVTCLWNSWKIAQTLQLLDRMHSLDVIHCPATFFESWVWGRYYKPRNPIPLVIKFHENRETYERIEGRMRSLKAVRRGWMRNYLAQVARQADYLMGVSANCLAGTLDYLSLNRPGVPTGVSPSPVDTEMFRPTSVPAEYFESFGLAPEQPYLFYSGRLIYEKGLHLLLEAFLNHLAPRYPQLALVVAGEFDYRQPGYEARLRDQMAGHPAADRVKLLGRVPYDCLPYWYSHCEVCVVPSFSEPFGRVFIEAMACKVPVVGFAAGGPTEFITNGVQGLLLKEQTSQQLAQGLEALLDNPGLRAQMGQAGRQTVVQQFGTRQVTADLVKLYRQLAKPKPYATPLHRPNRHRALEP